MNFLNLLADIEQKIKFGGFIDRSEASALNREPDENIMSLAGLADRIRIHFCGNHFDACSLINARAGRCSEDCKFCAQSAQYDTDCETYPLRSQEDILEAARKAKEMGASRFCTVTSGGALSPKDFDQLIGALEKVRDEVDIALDASLGFLDEQRADKLKAVGVTRYNHNIETAPEYYSAICTTHSFEDRVRTVNKVVEKGLSICSGGIIGMGETPEQRLDMAFKLRELGVDCVPINILNPRPGTPLESMEAIPPMEIIKTIALFRLILPQAVIKIAGGREKNLGDYQGTALRSGANGMIIGGYLTTQGRGIEDDLLMIRQAGYEISL